MKKRFLLFVAVSLFFASCQEELSVSTPETVLPERVIHAEIEQSNVTKTYIDVFRNIRFQKNDQIVLFQGEASGKKYQIEDAAEGQTAGDFYEVMDTKSSISNNSSSDMLIAYYPYSDLKLVAANAEQNSYDLLGVKLPQRQKYDPNHIISQNILPMTSIRTKTQGDILFKNLCGVLKFNVTGNVSIRTISLKGNQNEKLCGPGKVSLRLNQNPVLTMDENSIEEVILDCGRDGVALNETEAQQFMIVLPPTNFEKGFEVTLTDINGGYMSMKTTRQEVVSRSNILNMAEIAYQSQSPADMIPDTEIWYETSQGNICETGNPSIDYFGANLLSNTYVNGKGVMTFDGPVTKIGRDALDLQMKMDLVKVTLPQSVTEIGNNVFSDCEKLTTINIPRNLKTIGNSAFLRCRLLEEIVLPESLTSVGEDAFAVCQTIKYLIFPEGLKTLGNNALNSCDNLREVYFKSIVPPVPDAFTCYSDNVHVFVPEGHVGSYNLKWELDARTYGYDYSSNKPKIYINLSKCNHSALAGEDYFEYKIADPINIYSRPSVSFTSSESWVSNFHSDFKKVSFQIAKNDAASSREAVVSVMYGDADPVTFTVSQLQESKPDLVLDVLGVKIPFIKVAGGTFTMGVPNDYSNPAHKVTLSDFYIGQYEVTQELWETVMGKNPSYHKGNPQLPVEYVSWDEIVELFLPKLNELTNRNNIILPTEAQWEYAAKGGNQSKHFTYSGSNSFEDVAWVNHNSYHLTHPVGLKQPNELGIYDMNGNVKEWCTDQYAEYGTGSVIEPLGPVEGEGIVLRGGSFGDYPRKTTDRTYWNSNGNTQHMGFRLVISDNIKYPVHSVWFNIPELSLKVGDSRYVKEHVEPGNAYDRRVTWSSSRPTVASVDAKGKVTAVSPGVSTITVETIDGGHTASYKVTVNPVGGTDYKDFTVNGESFRMIKVYGGDFFMGATADQGPEALEIEKPMHKVTLSDYYIGKFEVTQRLWTAVMGTNPSYYKGDLDCPVEQVSWYDIVNKFLPRLNALTGENFTLPTEAQWEYAARGGYKSHHSKYSGTNNYLKDYAWFQANGNKVPHRVGQKFSNELGLYDMSGNVVEWCSDWFGPYTSEPQTNPTGASSGTRRILKGGTFWQQADMCRVAVRYIYEPDACFGYTGFRLALSSK